MNKTIGLLDLVIALSSAIDLISNKVYNHHKRVAYISLNLGKELGLNGNDLFDLVIASSLHDIGALSIKERLEIFNFEAVNAEYHAETGYFLLKSFKPFSNIAELIRYHHAGINKRASIDGETFIKSNIIHLADRIDISIDENKYILNQVKDIRDKINDYSNIMFQPEIVDAFNNLATKESFWLDLVNPSIDKFLYSQVKLSYVKLGTEEILEVSKLFALIIDFRSRFTSTHSSGVAATAEKLAVLYGFNYDDSLLMKVAGYLHDLGKLAVPSEILNKNDKLTVEEFNIIKSHTYYTRRILENIKGFETINDWASLHHERLDGTGYPFHFQKDNLSIGSRIMAVADVFTAITEERPYRKGMNRAEVVKLLNKMVGDSALDESIVALLITHYDLINETRSLAQAAARDEYLIFNDREISYGS